MSYSLEVQALILSGSQLQYLPDSLRMAASSCMLNYQAYYLLKVILKVRISLSLSAATSLLLLFFS